MKILRTPDERFKDLPDYPFKPNYLQLGELRMHYLDEGPRGAPVVLMLHGEPTWSYLYRKMIPPLVAGGYRAVAPDLIGFGRSDKLPRRDQYTYASHLAWTRAFIDELGLKDIVLFCQDWGGLLGLRIAAENEERFARIVAANTALPIGTSPGKGFEAWKRFSQETEDFHTGGIVKGGCHTELSPEVVAAYDAPFPTDAYKEAARQFPMLVPVTPDDPEAANNIKAWSSLAAWSKPLLCLFGEHDRVLGRADTFLIENVPGAANQPHARFEAGHFIQEDVGEELAASMLAWMA